MTTGKHLLARVSQSVH